ncbi:hypothetical protein [Deinococcus sp. AB2017081]|nr:hypothetical protein [Deinococcus sp. AB2017081]WQE97471.1 hypothetical protein U2P90_19910 [Deinococcus sp. AB2017081]
MLAQHLQDVTDTRALIEELEAAQAEHESVAGVRQSMATIKQLAAEYESVAAEGEAALIATLERLHAISRAHKLAQGAIRPAFQAAAARGSGYTPQDVAQVLSQSGLGPQGQAGRDRVQGVNAALEAFAELIGPEHAYAALELTRASAFVGAPSLQPRGYRFIAEALAGYVPQGG